MCLSASVWHDTTVQVYIQFCVIVYNHVCVLKKKVTSGKKKTLRINKLRIYKNQN